MSRTKMIYFLSAFVLIIGCFALNKSYSLFTATAESDSIESTVPKLDVSLSLNSITIEAGKEYLIKQTITNNSVVPVNFGITSDNIDNVKIAKHDSIPNNITYGIKGDTDTSLASNTSKDIYLIVSNSEGASDLTINFTLNKNYTTITTTSTNLSNITTEETVVIEEDENTVTLPYSNEPNTLKYKIIENYVNTVATPVTLSDDGTTNISSLFTDTVTKISYPISTGISYEFESPTSFTGTSSVFVDGGASSAVSIYNRVAGSSSKYYTYSDTYTIDSSNKYTLINTDTSAAVTYVKGYTSLEGKYVVSTSGSSTEAVASYSSLSTIYYITKVEGSYIYYIKLTSGKASNEYYYTYGDSYEFNEENGTYSIVNSDGSSLKTVQYNTNIETLKNKYIVSYSGSASATVVSAAGNTNIYKVSSGSTDLILKYHKVTKASKTASKESKLLKASDDYGNSYYFRGGITNNYVSFAGFTWRIVRINGDGSIRIILNGTLDKVKVNGTPVGSTIAFKSSPYNDNAYVGYMYGLAATTTDADRCLVLVDGTVTDMISTYTTQSDCEANGGKWTTDAYHATHANVGDSTIKTAIDTFYKTYITSTYTDTDGNTVTNSSNIDSNGIGYENYLADTIFCGDKTFKSGTGIGTATTYYGAYNRLYDISTVATPTLLCAEGASDDYSRYTVSKQIINNVETNGDLTYPIALLSADEVLMAGAFKNVSNESFYLYDATANGLSTSNWWTMSPWYGSSVPYLFISQVVGGTIYNSSNYGTRPVINLRSDLLWSGGDGSSGTPYEVSLPNEG